MTVKIDTSKKCINSIKGVIFGFVPGITGALLSMGIGTNHFDYSEFRVFSFIFAPLIIICIVDIVNRNRKAINQISFEDNKIIVESNGQSSSFGYDDIRNYRVYKKKNGEQIITFELWYKDITLSEKYSGNLEQLIHYLDVKLKRTKL